MQSQPDTTKAGWRKIRLACQQAKDDGYGYVWCDTCCIDKSSSAELSESINSMFRWYQEAEVCYAFLDDVQDIEELAGARWFTRGWTLQELIAPKRLVFYNAAWTDIGTRKDLAKEVSEIVAIDEEFLAGANSLSKIRGASFAKRVAWAANRITTRNEDIAYCLMGLLDVNMPLLYGEGGIKAFRRLQEEFLKVNVDQSFLTWRLRRENGGPNTSDGNLLASHPKDFQQCNRISLAGDDVAPFSLNNKGLRIHLPLFQKRRVHQRSPEYFAVLACHLDGAIEHRIGIPLRAVEKSTETFTLLPRERHHHVSTDEFAAARFADCFILRNPKPLTPRMLSISNLPASLFLWKPEILYLDTSTSTWVCLSKPLEPKIPLIRVPAQRERASYGVLFCPPSPYPDVTSNDYENTPCLKVLIRLDVGIEEQYSLNVRIQLFQVVRDEFFADSDSLPSVPSAEIPSHSRSQIVSIPARLSETLNASASWKRVSSQDVLSFEIHLTADDENRAHELYTRSISILKSLLTRDPLVHSSLNTMIAILMYFAFVPSTLTLYMMVTLGICAAASSISDIRRIQSQGLVRPEYEVVYWDILLVLCLLLLGRPVFDHYNHTHSTRYSFILDWLFASWIALCLLWDLKDRTGYKSTHKEQPTAKELDDKIGLESLLVDTTSS